MAVESQSSERKTHRLWIQQARLQTEEAESHSFSGSSISKSEFRPDMFPGYSLEGEIHRGGQGTVYRALQKSTGRRVAVKLLHNHAFGGPLERARFERESRVLAALRHPNIVTIHDGGSHDGRFFLVMDYISGQPLDVYMASQSRPIRETLELFVQICNAVNAAHLGGVIHRDIKPANIRVDASGRPVVLDFGLAKFTVTDVAPGEGQQPNSNMTLTGQFLGSLPWAAPEQADGHPGRIDTRTDVYALGVVLYQMLTGKFPYPVVGNVRAVLDSIVKSEPIPPRTLSKDIDDELETIVLKCLSKERERRYQTAGELSRDVQAYLRGEPIDAKRDSAWYLLRKSVRRYWLPASIASVFLLLLIGSSIIAWTLSVRAHDATAIARRAEESARRSAEDSRITLRDSLIAQASAKRRTGRIGQRFEALDALKRSAAISATVEARNEAIAAMALPDLRIIKEFSLNWMGAFSRDLEICAFLASDGTVTVVRSRDDSVIGKIGLPEVAIQQVLRVSVYGNHVFRMFDPVSGDRVLEAWRVPDLVKDFEIRDIPYQASFDVSQDDSLLAVCRMDKAVHFYDLQSGAEQRRIPLDHDSAYVKLDPGGHRLLVFHSLTNSPSIINLETGKSEPAFESEVIQFSADWQPNGDLIAGARGSSVILYDVRAHRNVATLTGHEVPVTMINFSTDGRFLHTYSWDGAGYIWDVASRRKMLRTDIGMPTFSSQNRLAGSNTISGRVYCRIFEFDPANEYVQVLSRDNLRVPVECSGDFHPGSSLFLTVCRSITREAEVLRVYDYNSRTDLAAIRIPGVRTLAIDPTGNFILSGHDHGVYRWPISSFGHRLKIGPPTLIVSLDNLESIDITPDSQKAVALSWPDPRLAIINLNSSASPRFLQCHAEAHFVRISEDGRLAAVGSWRGNKAEVWDLQKESRIREMNLAHTVTASIAPDGQSLVTTDSSSLCQWDMQTWKPVKSFPASPYGRFTQSKRMFATHLNLGGLRLLDWPSLAELATFEAPQLYQVSDYRVSGDDALIAEFVNRSGIVNIWNLKRIRANLRDLGLDWSSSSTPPTTQPPLLDIQSVEIDAGDLAAATSH